MPAIVAETFLKSNPLALLVLVAIVQSQQGILLSQEHVLSFEDNPDHNLCANRGNSDKFQYCEKNRRARAWTFGFFFSDCQDS